MTVRVSIMGTGDHTFNCVEGVTFHSGPANITELPVAQWTRYQEEGRGSEDLVNVDLSMLTLDSVDYIHGELCVFVREYQAKDLANRS